NPRSATLASLPSDFAVKNSRDVNGNLLTTSGMRFESRFIGSAGQLNAVGQSVMALTGAGTNMAAVLTGPAYLGRHAQALTLTSLAASAVVDTVVKVTKQAWNGLKDAHSRVTLTVANTGTTAVSGPVYIEFVGIPPGATLFNSAGKRPSTGRPYLVAPIT